MPESKFKKEFYREPRERKRRNNHGVTRGKYWTCLTTRLVVKQVLHFFGLKQLYCFFFPLYSRSIREGALLRLAPFVATFFSSAPLHEVL
jgi:hypothetical protein